MNSVCSNCKKRDCKCGPKISAIEWQESFAIVTERVSRQTRLILPAQPRTPDEQRLTPFEESYIRGLRDGRILFKFKNLQFSRQDDGKLWHNLFRCFGPNISSPSIRHACILYSIYKHGNAIPNNHYYERSLCLFYLSTETAIEREADHELVYACFAWCMYSLCVHRDFDEIATYATGFSNYAVRLAANSPLLDTEEIFLFECMWEKLLWTMLRELLFKDQIKVSDSQRIIELCKPLSLEDYTKYPLWMQESYLELSTKIDLIRSFMRLRAYHEAQASQINAILRKRFVRDFVAWVTSHISELKPASHKTWALLRTLSRTLWSSLLELLLSLIEQVPNDNGDASDALISVLSLIEIIPNVSECYELVDQLINVVDIATCCLVSIGLLICRHSDPFCISQKSIILINIDLQITRFHLAGLEAKGTGGSGGLLLALDSACFELCQIPAEAYEGDSQAFSKWVEIYGCGILSNAKGN